MPLRGDFVTEYDNDAEMLLAEMDFSDLDSKEDIKTKFRVLALYNRRLDERIRRKRFVIDHGLLDTKRLQQLERKRRPEEKEMYALLKPFMQYCQGHEFEDLVQGLLEERALRAQLHKLQIMRYISRRVTR